MRNIWGILGIAGLAIGAGAVGYGVMDGRFGASAVTASPATSTQPVAAPQIAQAGGKSPRMVKDDYVMGKADAPVTIIEYASLTCPHCAAFHNDILPQIKKTYVDTGKVKVIYRDFPLDRYALAASMVARCGGRERYFGFLDVLFRSQKNWASAADPLKAITQLARLGGMQPQRITACLGDEQLRTSVLQQRLHAAKDLKVTSTPTLFINGNRFNGDQSFDKIKAAIDPMLPKS